MKKVTLLALLAIMLIGMLAFAACKAKTEEAVPAESLMVEEAADTPAVVDSTLEAVQDAAGAVKEAAEAVKK